MKILLLLLCSILVSLTALTELSANQAIVWQATNEVEARKEPSATSELLFRFKSGTILQQLDLFGSWIKVRDVNSNAVGWVHGASSITTLRPDLAERCAGGGAGGSSCPVVGGVEHVEEEGKKKGKISSIPPISSSKETLQTQIGSRSLLADQTNVEHIDLESITGTTYIATPEQLTAVKMSSSDINRIVCSTDIKDVVFSEEKGVNVKLIGKNAFVKFVIKRIGGKETYSKIPVDMFIVCNEKVYSIIAVPERIPPVVVFLEDKESKIKDIINKNREMPYEKRIVNYVKDFMSGRIPIEATNTIIKKQYNIYEHLDITEISQHTIEREGLTARVFSVVGKKNLDIREKDFLKKEITDTPVAISLDKLKLAQGEKAILIIIEKTKR